MGKWRADCPVGAIASPDFVYRWHWSGPDRPNREEAEVDLFEHIVKRHPLCVIQTL